MAIERMGLVNDPVEDERCFAAIDGWMEDGPNYLWRDLFDSVSLDWIAAHQSEILGRFRAAVEREAAELYDRPILTCSTYAYSWEAWNKIRDGLGPHSDMHEREFDIHGKHIHVIDVMRNTTLRELTGDFTFQFAPNGIPRATDVRHAMRRQLRYLLSASGITEIQFNGRNIKKPLGGRAAIRREVENAVRRELPFGYPNMLQSKIRKHRFFDAHPEYDQLQNIIWELYNIAPEATVRYVDKAVSREKRHQAQWDVQDVLEWTPMHTNELHDAVYMFEPLTRILTKATLVEVLAWHPNKIRDVFAALGPLLTAKGIQQSHPTAADRKFVKQLLLGPNPIGKARDELTRITAEKEKGLYRKLKVDKEVASSFLERMQKYAPHASIHQMVDLFGVSGTTKMLTGTYEWLFAHEEFPIPLNFIGEHIQKAVGRHGKNAMVKNPKRLYHHLSKLGDVKKMVLGEIAEPERVLAILRRFGYDTEKEADQAISLRAVVEPKCSPEFLVAGDASVCCMSFGANNANSYALHRGFGVLNFYLGDRVIANSVLWINQLPVGRALVLDNAEVHPNYVRFNPFLKTLYQVVMKHLMEEYDCVVTVQGDNYNDLRLPTMYHPIKDFVWRINAVDVEGTSFYTDAYNFTVVGMNQSPQELANWVIEMAAIRDAKKENNQRQQYIQPEYMQGEDVVELAF